MTTRAACIADLRRDRPRSPALLWSSLGLAVLAAYSWIWGFASGTLEPADSASPQRLRNLGRFLDDVTPHPLVGREWDFGVAWDWAADLMARGGWQAALATLWISVAAAVLAGIGGALLAIPAARTVFRPDPFLPSPRPASAIAADLWWTANIATRGVLVFLRAIPEYVWTFLFVMTLGVSAWPAVLALAIHNAGILGRLQAEVVENVESGSPQHLRATGATRSQIVLFSVLPTTLNRFLLFFFYRWETCVREATVLGMLGVVSLGSVIREARTALRYDELLLFVLCGAAIVMVGDLVSALARGAVRRAS